jgi:hypothetical protein
MSRQVETGAPVFDSFPVFDSDGFTKKSGLHDSDFSVVVLVNGFAASVPVSITEVGATGDYRCSFTPLSNGLYQLQISVAYSKEVWGESYDASTAQTHMLDQLDKIDLSPTLGPSTVTSGSLMDRMLNMDADKSYNQATDSLQGLRNRIG